MTYTDRIFQTIQSLPVQERLRLVERVVHALADASGAEGVPRPAATAPSLLGLFADEPELVDEVCQMAMEARRRDPLRSRRDSDEGTS